MGVLVLTSGTRVTKQTGKCLWIFLCGLLNLTLTWGYQVHISTATNLGTVLFNSSHGRNWLYSIDRARSSNQIHRFVKLDSDGVLTLSEMPRCSELIHNPVSMYIESRTNTRSQRTNYTLTPLHLYIHGANCHVEYRNLEDKMIADTHTIVLTPGHQNGGCLHHDQDYIHISDYIPTSIKHCGMGFRDSSSNSLVTTSASGSLKTQKTVCPVDQSYLHFTSVLESLCGNLQTYEIPVDIYLKSSMTVNKVGKSSLSTLQMMNSVKHPNKRGRRRRRQTTNYPPQFQNSLYTANISEGLQPGRNVATITANDPDAGDSLSYILLANRDARSQEMFSIDARSGQVRTTQTLDREFIPIHHFEIVATDDGRPKASATTSLRITVDDANDHPPVFERTIYDPSVSEGLSVGSTVLTVRATDGDDGKNQEIRYSIVNSASPNDIFRMDPQIGTIVIMSRLDRETTASYTLQVVAIDQSPIINERKTATATVHLTVEDQNDNYPQFSRSSYIFSVSEDTDARSFPVIGKITAEDRDEGDNKKITYSITSGNAAGNFMIDSVTGDIKLLNELDHDQWQSRRFRLRVRAQDGGSPSRSNSTTVLIDVIDVNDNKPRFTHHVYRETIAENTNAGFSVLRVTALDEDSDLNAELIYSMKFAPANIPFVINPTSGWITTTRSIDREATPSFNFTVKVVDKGVPPQSAETRVEITIRDVNDEAPKFTKDEYHASVSEEAYPGQRVIEVTAVDRDEGRNSEVNYAIIDGNDNGKFSIFDQNGMGVIQVAGNLNYMEKNRYTLKVEASDEGGLRDEVYVYINVTDANTHRPVFQETPYRIRIPEDKPVDQSVFRVVAVDGDSGLNALIIYSMVGSDDFKIDPDTGVISVSRQLNRESTNGYTLSITATDQGIPPQMEAVDVEIEIDDVNDNAPKFEKEVYTADILEDALIGKSVVRISATDDDIALNGMVRYTFQAGNSGNGDFGIDPLSGVIRVRQELDRERIGRYDLVAYAVDRGTPEQSTSVSVVIDIKDINDNAPSFERDRITVYIPENSPIGSTVDTIRAVDPDEGDNSIVRYQIFGGRNGDDFELTESGNAAILKTRIELDYESPTKEYEVKIKASSAHLITVATVVVKVRDVNDNSPQLKDFKIIFNNFGNHFPTNEVGRIPAFDPDESDSLMYSFISGNEAQLLSLNRTSGMIRLDSRLNSDRPINGTLQVLVTDGKNDVRARCDLFVMLVTDDMLFNSITVRLAEMDQNAFLSPLYDYFIDGLSMIIPAVKEDIFIISVKDDTDVQDKVLNVSFSVRKEIDAGNNDVFYSQQFLKERVYLKRNELAKQSTLQVLPFDDNLCVREPCLNFEDCISTLKFANAADFISSSTMLFRPIIPVDFWQCRCPKGFTGMNLEYWCDIEVNLCYSSPCMNNGTCERHEGGYTCHCLQGFTGPNCDVDMAFTKYDKDGCPPNVCKPPSTCQSLIQNGFRCRGCLNAYYHNEFCEITTRSFPKGSFLMFPSLKKRHRFRIQLRFATRRKDALLLYNGRYNGKHDFIALEIVNHQVRFSFSLGTSVTTVDTFVEGGVNDGNWRQVTVEYLNRTATLTVGEKCDTEVQILYGKSNNKVTCAATVTHVLEARCADATETCHRFLDLTGPMHIGGVPSSIDFQLSNHDFEGCIRDVYIDQKFLDLNSTVSDNGTLEGCPQKESHCQGNICKAGGTCLEGWGTYMCKCTPGKGGKDCSQNVHSPKFLNGNGYLTYQPSSHNINMPNWVNGISFRTRQTSGLLMRVELNGASAVVIQIADGYIRYTYPQRSASSISILFDDIYVNDGDLHYLEVRWLQARIQLLLDYGQLVKTIHVADNSLPVGTSVGKVWVGGMGTDSVNVQLGLRSCIELVRVGNTDSQNSILENPSSVGTISTGCQLSTNCQSSPCPATSHCVDEWDDYTCRCREGYVGERCGAVCLSYNPCKHGSECIDQNNQGYQCKCSSSHSGQYCEIANEQPCPTSWWGYPICGPCNCPTEKGFSSSCNKANGQCSCKEFHFQEEGSDYCYPCNCYTVGSYGRECDSAGQCRCRKGVIGKRCDKCESEYAEVTREEGCKVFRGKCPKDYEENMWWPRTGFGQTAVENCPKPAIGKASRVCDENSRWQPPDMANCTSSKFIDLNRQLLEIESGQLQINTFVAKTLMGKLNEATNETDYMFRKDIDITNRLVKQLLKYESNQIGLNLTNIRDRNYIQNMLNTVSRILEPKYYKHWNKSGGAALLVKALEEYVNSLMYNMAVVFTKGVMFPFHAVTSNIVLGLDFISKDNFTGTKLPKYNNIVKKQSEMFDPHSEITLPEKIFGEPTVQDWINTVLDKDVQERRAVAGYILYKTLGAVLPLEFQEDTVDLHSESEGLIVNSPVFSLSLRDGNKTISGNLRQPINLKFKQLINDKRTSPQCVYWEFDEKSSAGGYWSGRGCTLLERSEQDSTGDKFVTCSCNHLTNFAILMDISDIEFDTQNPLEVEIVTYVGVAISLFFLVLTFMLLIAAQCGMESNANSIHINLVFCIFLAELVFVLGINQTGAELVCKLIAIALHFFFMCSFAWMFIESMHIYRMLTEIRNINRGSMKFYYAIGYIIPGIIVGLSVGLSTDGYGNKNFCWLSTVDNLIWSFAGPIVIVVAMNLFVFLLALKASCEGKAMDAEMGPIRNGLLAALVLLPLVGVTWVFALLSANYSSMLAYHYLFAFFGVFQGLFIFLAYILFDPRVRREMKRTWAKLTGQKFDDDLSATRTTMLSRSALAYNAHDSSLDGGLNRINIGISTTSTTSRSTSKTSSGGLYRPDGYLRSTSTSTSGNIPSISEYPNTGIPPYGFEYHEKAVDDPDTGEINHKHADSDSDSDLSVNGFELASSHSSDEDEDEFEKGQRWDQPTNKILERVKAQHKGPKHHSTPLAYPPPTYNEVNNHKNHWSGDHYSGSDNERNPSHKKVIVDMKGSVEKLPPPPVEGYEIDTKAYIVPPERTDSLPKHSSQESVNKTSAPSPKDRIAVQVLTHNGSVSSESEDDHETEV